MKNWTQLFTKKSNNSQHLYVYFQKAWKGHFPKGSPQQGLFKNIVEIASAVGKTNVKNIAPHPAQKGIYKKSQVKSLEESH